MFYIAKFMSLGETLGKSSKDTLRNMNGTSYMKNYNPNSIFLSHVSQDEGLEIVRNANPYRKLKHGICLKTERNMLDQNA